MMMQDRWEQKARAIKEFLRRRGAVVSVSWPRSWPHEAIRLEGGLAVTVWRINVEMQTLPEDLKPLFDDLIAQEFPGRTVRIETDGLGASVAVLDHAVMVMLITIVVLSILLMFISIDPSDPYSWPDLAIFRPALAVLLVVHALLLVWAGVPYVKACLAPRVGDKASAIDLDEEVEEALARDDIRSTMDVFESLSEDDQQEMIAVVRRMAAQHRLRQSREDFPRTDAE